MASEVINDTVMNRCNNVIFYWAGTQYIFSSYLYIYLIVCLFQSIVIALRRSYIPDLENVIFAVKIKSGNPRVI